MLSERHCLQTFRIRCFNISFEDADNKEYVFCGYFWMAQSEFDGGQFWGFCPLFFSNFKPNPFSTHFFGGFLSKRVLFPLLFQCQTQSSFIQLFLPYDLLLFLYSLSQRVIIVETLKCDLFDEEEGSRKGFVSSFFPIPDQILSFSFHFFPVLPFLLEMR